MIILFDLDGTLLPMDEDKFIDQYLRSLAIKFIPLGYDPKTLVETIWGGVRGMYHNDGSLTNEDVFWNYFNQVFGQDSFKDKPVFEDYYANEFQQVKESCRQNELAISLIRELKEKGIRFALATNPLFPEIATCSRIRWAGLDPEDFELITTYEHSVHSKPTPDYYLDVARELQVDPSECIMIGNNVEEDLSAEKVGMKVFLLTDCLINRHNTDYSQYPHGNFEDLKKYLETVIETEAGTDV